MLIRTPRTLAALVPGQPTMDGNQVPLTRLVPGADESAAEPGSIVRVGREAFTVQTGSGPLDVVSIQPEGRRVMPARDFAAGHLGAGARFDDPPETPAGAPGAGPS